jgi:hypothetical protein
MARISPIKAFAFSASPPSVMGTVNSSFSLPKGPTPEKSR